MWASHELKSCSATIGAYSLAAHCERLEFMVRERFVPDPASSVEASVSNIGGQKPL
jgi:hypothetical protein